MISAAEKNQHADGNGNSHHDGTQTDWRRRGKTDFCISRIDCMRPRYRHDRQIFSILNACCESFFCQLAGKLGIFPPKSFRGLLLQVRSAGCRLVFVVEVVW
jgi:hypothetical protein